MQTDEPKRHAFCKREEQNARLFASPLMRALGEVTGYDSVIFDLDGTLWDAAEASAQGWNAVLESKGVATHLSAADIRSVSGMPFEACVEALLGQSQISSDSDFRRTLDAGERRSIERIGGRMFDGVADGVKLLSKQWRLFLISNCQEWYLEAFWRHSALKGYFSGYDCHGSSRASKAAMISRLVFATAATRSIYVGDTEGDGLAASAAGVDFAHVSYGFGRAEHATATFESFPELVAWFDRAATPYNALEQARDA